MAVAMLVCSASAEAAEVAWAQPLAAEAKAWATARATAWATAVAVAAALAQPEAAPGAQGMRAQPKNCAPG